MGNVKILSASAGSGKTYTLAYEYVRNVVRQPELYRHILAVTFTNKATEEMKQRILEKINLLARGGERDYLPKLVGELGYTAEEVARRAAKVRGNILHDYSRFSVLTIDKFFQRIIRSFIRELGIETDFTLELPVDNLLTKASDRVIDNISTNKDLREWVIAFVNERIEESKQWDIRAEIVKLGREVFSESYKRGLAGARARNELAEIVKARTAEKEALKAGLKKRAGELLGLITGNGIDPADFYQGGKGAGAYIAKLAEGDLKEPNSYVSKALSEGVWYTKTCPNRDAIDSIADKLHDGLSEVIDLAATARHKENTVNLLRENFRNFALLTDLQEKIYEVAREENILHISEINVLLSKLIAGNDTPFIFEKTGNHFSHFMIDEFQDTSIMQWENFIPLLNNAVSQSGGTPVMLVGDVKQSIYRWRGGDWTILSQKAPAEFGVPHPESLVTNFRSLRNVVEFNNAMIKSVTETDNESLNLMLESAVEKGSVSSDFGVEMKNSVNNAYIDLRQHPDKQEDAGQVTIRIYDKGEDGKPTVPPVIATIEEVQARGFEPRDIAILVRRNTEGKQIAEMLLKHKEENPSSVYGYDVITQEALVIGTAAICNFLLSCMKLSVNTEDAISRTVYNRYLALPLNEGLRADETEFLSQVRLRPLEEAFETLVMHYALSSRHDEISYLQAFHEQIISFANSRIADIPLFIQWWEDSGRKESISMSSDINAITIDTIHRAKGLGYKVVIMPYTNWDMNPKSNSVVWSQAAGDKELGTYPVRYKKTMGESAFAEDFFRELIMSHIDNLNLFYVAVTRAKEELHIMFPQTVGNPGKKQKGHKVYGSIGDLIAKTIETGSDKVALGSLTGEKLLEEEVTTIRFGKPVIHKKQANKDEGRIRMAFNAYDIGERIRLKVKSQRYFDDGAGDDRLTPRDYGILMHRVFEQASDLDEIGRIIDEQLHSGALTNEEAGQLGANISTAMLDPVVNGWFDGSWEQVRNENEIIIPADQVTHERNYRPDRVMTRGGQAVVVDYKFGLGADNRYAKQIAGYKSLLASMGYTDVKGYIWYVSLGRIVEV